MTNSQLHQGFEEGLNSAFVSWVKSANPNELQRYFETDPSPTFGYGESHCNFYLDEEYLGQAVIHVMPSGIYWKQFFPLEACEDLKGNGIGTLAHVGTLLSLSETQYVGLWTPVHHEPDGVSEERAGHLQGMNLDPRVQEPFIEYVAESIDYANKKGFYYEINSFIRNSEAHHIEIH